LNPSLIFKEQWRSRISDHYQKNLQKAKRILGRERRDPVNGSVEDLQFLQAVLQDYLEVRKLSGFI